MKKTVVLLFLFFLTTTIVSDIFASRDLTITQYCGQQGLIERGNDPVRAGDVLNIQQDITQSIRPADNKILSEGIVINGNGYTLDGNKYGGFIMEKYDSGSYAFSQVNNMTLTNYGPFTDGAVFNVKGFSDLFLTDVNVINNSAAGFMIGTNSSVNIYANKDIYFKGNKDALDFNIDNGGSLFFYALPDKNIYVEGAINGNGKIKVGNGDNYTGTLVLGGNNEDFYGESVYVNGATIKLLAGSTYFNNVSTHTFYKGKLDMANNVTETVSFGVLDGYIMKIDLDADLAQEKTDYMNVGQMSIGGDVVINKINVMSDSQNDKVIIGVIRPDLSENLILDDSQKRVFGPVYSYDVVYDEVDSRATSGGRALIFTRATEGFIYNPENLQSKVAVAGIRVSQEDIFDTIFNNAGNYTFFQKQGTSAGDVEDRAAPTLWVKAFGSKEDVDLDKYTKIETTYYGAVAGLDFDRTYSDLFDATYGIFASYIGGELKDGDYDNKVKQNGGYAGVRANWYIGKFFVNAIADYGVLTNTADTNSDSADFNSQVIGLAARLGYNFEVVNKSFTIQPSVGVTGKYIITDDFDTVSGDTKIDDISNITVEPGLKLAKTLGKCWILSAEGKYVVEEVNGDIKVNDILLPEMSYDNYASFGFGIEKIWGYTVLHLKANRTIGGRDGVILNAGIEFKF